MIAGTMANVIDFIPPNVDPSTTDVTQYFLAAFAANKSIYVPNGTYVISELKLESGYEIHGQNKKDVILKGLSTTVKMIKTNDSPTDYGNLPSFVTDIVLENFSLDMSDMVDSSDRSGIYIAVSYFGIIRNVSLVEPGGVFPVNSYTLNIDGFTYNYSIYDCIFPFVRACGRPIIGAVNGFSTTINFYTLNSYGVTLAYINSSNFYSPILQKEFDKFSFGPIVGNIQIIGGDIEQAEEKYYLNGNGNTVGAITSFGNTFQGLEGGYKDNATTWSSCNFSDEYTAYGPRVLNALTRSGTVATGTTVQNHMLNSGDQCEIVGASDANFNGFKIVTVTGAKTFTYTVANTGATDGFAAGSYVAPNWQGNNSAWYPLGDKFYRNISGSRWVSDNIYNTGNLYLGSQAAISDNRAVVLAAGGSKIGFEHQTPSDNYIPEIFYNAAGVSVGNINCTASTTAYATSSDYRLKENISPMTGALAVVSQLKPVTYNWKADGSSGQGFIAHELQEVVPDCVTGEKDAVDAENKPIYQGIDTSFLVATLVKAIQELKSEFDEYKATHP